MGIFLSTLFYDPHNPYSSQFVKSKTKRKRAEREIGIVNIKFSNDQKIQKELCDKESRG